jgi:hypothetical protein
MHLSVRIFLKHQTLKTHGLLCFKDSSPHGLGTYVHGTGRSFGFESFRGREIQQALDVSRFTCSGFAANHQYRHRMIHALKLYEPTVPYWVKGKLFIWLLAAGSVALSVRFSRYALTLLIFYAAMVMAAAWLVLYRPF